MRKVLAYHLPLILFLVFLIEGILYISILYPAIEQLTLFDFLLLKIFPFFLITSIGLYRWKGEKGRPCFWIFLYLVGSHMLFSLCLNVRFVMLGFPFECLISLVKFFVIVFCGNKLR